METPEILAWAGILWHFLFCAISLVVFLTKPKGNNLPLYLLGVGAVGLVLAYIICVFYGV